MTYDIDALKRKVLHRYPYFGGLAAGLTYEEADLRDLAKLSVGQQIFVLARQLCHIAFRHTQRGQGKDPIIWKTATDAVVTQMLKRDGLELTPDAVDYPEAAGYDAEQFYEILLQHKMQIQLLGGRLDPQESTGKLPDEGEWEQVDDGMQQIIEDDGTDDDRQRGNDGSDDGDSGKTAPDDDDAGREPSAEDRFRELAESEDQPDSISQQEAPGRNRDKREDEDEEDLQDQELLLRPEEVSTAGNSIKRAVREVPDIGTGAPLINWRMLLRDTMNYDMDWSFTHAVLEDGIVRPILEEQPMPETEIVLDTSWSVDEELLRRFLHECKNILPYSKLKAGCFDTVFYGFHDIRTEDDIENMTFEGGGGTDFNVAVDAFTQRVDNRIIFTDGKAPLPEKYTDAIWVIYGDEKIEPPGGKVIHCLS